MRSLRSVLGLYTRGQEASHRQVDACRALRRSDHEVEPDIVSMENVPRLASFEDGRILDGFVGRLEEAYEVTVETVPCARYGVPQHRTRLVLLASKLGRLRLADPVHSADRPATVRDAIGELPAISHGEAHESDRIHMAPKLSELNMKRIRASGPGGTWEDWPEELLAECHRKESGRWYRNVYGRMAWGRTVSYDNHGMLWIWQRSFRPPGAGQGDLSPRGGTDSDIPSRLQVRRGERACLLRTDRKADRERGAVALAEAIALSIAKHIEESLS